MQDPRWRQAWDLMKSFGLCGQLKNLKGGESNMPRIEDKVEKAIEMLEDDLENLELMHEDEKTALIKGDQDEEDDRDEFDEDEEFEEEYEKALKDLQSLDHYDMAEIHEDVEKSGHEGERDRYGNIIVKANPEDVPEWLRNVDMTGIEYDPAEVQRGIAHELRYHTADPREAEQIVYTHLEEHPQYYSLLEEMLRRERNIGISKSMSAEPEPPQGMKWDPVYNRLVDVPEAEIKKAEEMKDRHQVEFVEHSFRKSIGLKDDISYGTTKSDLTKILQGESLHKVYKIGEDGNEQLIKCETKDEAELKASEILEGADDKERWGE
jgi:hypothetical protein